MHKNWEEIFSNANGHLNTIAQEKGESWGGLHIWFNREEEIAAGIVQCIEKIKKMNKILQVVYGYSV